MVYSVPQFNLLARIWDCRFPADGDPDWEDVPVQKYIRSRMSLDVGPQVEAGWWQNWTPPIQLRFPRDHLAFVDPPALWSHLSFEVPAGSGQFYRAQWQEVQHQGFVNEYAIILVTPCDEAGLAIPPPSADTPVGAASDACVSPPPPPGIDLEDHFNDTPGTPLASHTMDQGPGWEVGASGSDWEIAGGGDECVPTVGGTPLTVAYSDGETWDGDLYVQWEVDSPGDDSFGVVARVSDSDNYYTAYMTPADGSWTVGKMVGGSFTSIDDGSLPASFSAGDQGEVFLLLDGDQLSVTFRGPLITDEVILGPYTDSSLATGTSWGMVVPANAAPRCKYFRYTPPA